MYTLIKGGEVYIPKYSGFKDILLYDDKIVKIGNDLDKLSDLLEINQIIKADNQIVIPGLIDCHVHFNGGGGVGYHSTRCPDIHLSALTKAGVTTAIGCLGIDCSTKSLEGLLGKAQMLEVEGVSTYVLTGGYHNDRVTITGNVTNDIVFIDKIIGTGEIALSEERAVEIGFEQLKQVASETYLGGLLGEKAGVLVIHLGSGKKQSSLVYKLIEETDVPLEKFVITHVNRNQKLLSDALEFSKLGLNIDITAGLKPGRAAHNAVKPSEALKWLIGSGASLENITMSTDGNGGRAILDNQKNLKGIYLNEINFLFEELKDLINEEGVELEKALEIITSNPSKIYRLYNKGFISEGKDADIVILSRDLEIDKVIAKGKTLVAKGKPLVKSLFE